MKKYVSILAWVLCTAAAQADVKIDMKPGLWENTIKMSDQSARQMQEAYGDQMKQAMAEMQKQLAEMPPEQRKMMEEAMAASGMKITEQGVTYDGGNVSISNDKTVVKNCVTQADIDKGRFREAEEGCTSTLTQVDKKRIKTTEICTGEYPSSSEMEIHFLSQNHYTGKGKTTQTVEGKTVEINVSLEGKWLAGDCGELSPKQ